MGMPSRSSGLGQRLIVLTLLTGTWLVLRQQFQKPPTVEPHPAGVTSAPIQLAGLPGFLEIGVSNQRLVLERACPKRPPVAAAIGCESPRPSGIHLPAEVRCSGVVFERHSSLVALSTGLHK